MKKKQSEVMDDDLRPHYDFDFKSMKVNRFASEVKVPKQTLVVLDEDVSVVFDSSESVNTVLRSAIRAMRTAGGKQGSRSEMPARRSSKRRAS